MKRQITQLLLGLILIACNQKQSEDEIKRETESKKAEIAKTIEENYVILDDSLLFSGATIENFDLRGNSIDVYWIGKERDTTLRFYRKYDDDKNLIGAEYFEEGDLEPSRDTVYYNEDGLKVEASLNAENKISWKSTFKMDDRGNPVLKTYENGNGEYRGLDSLYFDSQNRVVKGFYENAKGKRSRIKTYRYTRSDSFGNWTERKLFINDTLTQTQVRIITYH